MNGAKQVLALMLFSFAQLTIAAGAPAPERQYPEGVAVARSKLGNIFVDARGRTLYALNVRQAAFRSGARTKYCVGPCERTWAVFAAPADAKPVGDWKVSVDVRGPQWTYKSNLVFVFATDRKPGDVGGDGYDDLWSVISYVPPVPTLTAPANVAARFADGVYVLADNQGHALFVAAKSGACGTACVEWSPFLAGLAGQGVGDWSVVRDGDRPQWAYHGQRVFVSQDVDPTLVPANGKVIKP